MFSTAAARTSSNSGSSRSSRKRSKKTPSRSPIVADLDGVEARGLHDRLEHDRAAQDHVAAVGLDAGDAAALRGRHLGQSLDQIAERVARQAEPRVVRVPAWRHYTAEVARRYLHRYRSKGPGHNHIHGANMGFRADAYWHVGGFRALATREDVELVERFEAAGLRIHRDASLSVATSDRRDGRAPAGFAHHLRGLSASMRRHKAEEPA